MNALVAYWCEKSLSDGASHTAISIRDLVQLSFWKLEDVEINTNEKATRRSDREQVLSEEALFEHITNYLLHETVFVDGTLLPVPLRKLDLEDRLLVAEALTWKGHLGSGETLNRKLKTKQGPELRDTLIRRGLLDASTQRPIRASDRLAPLLQEVGMLSTETEESQAIDPQETDEEEQEERA